VSSPENVGGSVAQRLKKSQVRLQIDGPRSGEPPERGHIGRRRRQPPVQRESISHDGAEEPGPDTRLQHLELGPVERISDGALHFGIPGGHEHPDQPADPNGLDDLMLSRLTTEERSSPSRRPSGTS
jgi:hypothetical protein